MDFLDFIKKAESGEADASKSDPMVLPSGYRMREADRADWALHLREVGGSCANCLRFGKDCPAGMRNDGGLDVDFLSNCACSDWLGLEGSAADILAAMGCAVIAQ
jgi:hypothetical protein